MENFGFGLLLLKMTIMSFCFFYTTQLVAQVSNGTMGDVVVCGGISNWEVEVEQSGTLVIQDLPPGFTFEGLVTSDCGVIMTNISPPTFNVPGACIITYSVSADCDAYKARDPQQGGDPNFSFAVDYTFNNVPISLDLISETNSPQLTVELSADVNSPNPYEPFIRVIRVCQDGLDAYIDDPIEVCTSLGANVAILGAALQTSGGSIPLTLNSSNCMTINTSQFQHALNRQENGVGDFSDLLEGSDPNDNNSTAECLYVEFELQLESCDVNADFSQEITSTWGCNGDVCALPSVFNINSNVSNGIPFLEMEYKSDEDEGCINESFRLNKVFITNSGTGPAANVVFNMTNMREGLEHWYFNSTFDVGSVYILNADGSQTPIDTDPGRITNYTIRGSQPECHDRFDALGGVEQSTSFETVLPITIEPGQTITIVVPQFLCCESSCHSFNTWRMSSGMIESQYPRFLW